MSLSIMITELDGNLSASLMDIESREEAEQNLKDAGSDEEKVVDFFNFDSEAADAIAGIALVNIECEDGIGQELERIILTVYRSGREYGVK